MDEKLCMHLDNVMIGQSFMTTIPNTPLIILNNAGISGQQGQAG